MGFLTEMFSRPRPGVIGRLPAGHAGVETAGPGRRIDFAIRPADFPRLARDNVMR